MRLRRLLTQPAFDVFQHQHPAERRDEAGQIGADPWQVTHQLAHIVERAQRHDRGNNKESRQPARPIRLRGLVAPRLIIPSRREALSREPCGVPQAA